MVDATDLLIGAKVKWVYDRVKLLAETQPRHIGRVCSFTFYTTEDSNNYDSYDVIGTFEGHAGKSVQCNGIEYPWARISDLKIYRSELA